MGGQLKISTINALRIFNQAFGLIFRRSEDHLHLIPTNEGEGENGDIGSLRPFSINLRSGLVSIGNGLKVGGSVTGNLTGNADTATKIKTARKIGGVAFDGSADINLHRSTLPVIKTLQVMLRPPRNFRQPERLTVCHLMVVQISH